ncbi:MAG: S8 family serine peptidase, partial [Solobacterium sp.]|nr:S8 family serine peptidase [Solobacterium sp.]
MKRKEQFRKTAAALVSALMISFLPAVSAEEESRDYTGLQWYYSGEYGTIFPGWNTYDESGNAIPNVDPAKEIVIAVVDSGVDYNHEDLKNVMWDKGLEYPQLAALGGGKYGLNTLGGDPADPMDDRGHGTHVAGIIAAEWNHIGVSGALSGVKIMAVRATGGMTESVKKGFEYVLAAKRAGVNIAAVNLSWNGSVVFSMPEILNEVITELGKENVVTVIAAGNDGISHDEEMQVSTFLRSNPYVIEVASNDESGQISDFSNYGVHYTDVIAPGGHILSTVPDLSQGGSYEPEEFFPEEEFPEEELPEEVPGSLTEGEEKEEPQAEEPEETPTASLSLGEEGEAPFADPLYAYENGTSMAAPIVSAEAAYLYSLNPGMSAQERAAHVINTSKISSVSEGKVYGGFADVSRAGTFAGWPFVSDTAYDYETGVLTVIGYDFGKGNGSLSIDGKQTSVKTWSDHKITAAVKNLAMGEHLITIQNGKEKKSRWMNISAESKDLKAVNTGLTGVSPSAMCVKGEDIYLAVYRSDGNPDTEFLRMKRGESSFTKIAAKERFGAVSAAAVNDLICFTDGNILLTMDGSGKNMQSTTLIFPDGYGMRPVIHSSGGHLFVTYSYGDSFYIGEADLSSGKISVLLQMALSSWRDAGFSEKDGVITFAVTGSEDYESSLMRVYRFVIGEEKAEQLFEIRNASVEAMDKASCLIKDQAVYLFGLTGTDQNRSWHYDLLEYTLEGEQKKRETLGGGHLHLLFAGE